MGIIVRYGNSSPQSTVGALVGAKDGKFESPPSACERRFSTSSECSSLFSTARAHTLKGIMGKRAKATMDIVDVTIFMKEN